MHETIPQPLTLHPGRLGRMSETTIRIATGPVVTAAFATIAAAAVVVVVLMDECAKRIYSSN